MTLFYSDNAAFFNVAVMRASTEQFVAGCSLMQRCAFGERRAAEAMMIGFAPFVLRFEGMIDRHPYPLAPLRARFGRDRVQQLVRELAHELFAMAATEEAHAQLWRADARELGLSDLERSPLPGVARLIACAYETDMPKFLSFLCGAELVAAKMSQYLLAAPRFLALFARGRFAFGDAHLDHDDEDSHFMLDLDLARAYAADPAEQALIPLWIGETVGLFNRAAQEIEMQIPADSSLASP